MSDILVKCRFCSGIVAVDGVIRASARLINLFFIQSERDKLEWKLKGHGFFVDQ